mgnify:FL=1
MRRSGFCIVFVTLFILGSISPASLNTDEWNNSSNQAFAAEGNNSSTLGWISTFGGSTNDYLVETIVYENGTSVSVGWFQGNIQFRDVIDGLGATGGSQDFDFFFTWMDENGNITSALSGGSDAVDSIDAIDILPNGDLLIAGTYCLNSVSQQCELSLGELSPLTKKEQDEDGNAFLARLDSSGEWVWSTQIQNITELFVIDMMVSETNEIHLAVSFRETLEFNETMIPATNEPSLLIATYDENGAVLSHVAAEAADGIEKIGSLCSDGSGQMYVAVTYTGQLIINNDQYDSVGSTDVVIASFSEFGWNWAISGGGIGEDRGWGLRRKTHRRNPCCRRILRECYLWLSFYRTIVWN